MSPMASTLGWLAIVVGVAILSAAITRIVAGRTRAHAAGPRPEPRPLPELLVVSRALPEQPPIHYVPPASRRLTGITR